MTEKIFEYEGDHSEHAGEIEVADMRHTRELAEPAAPPEPAIPAPPAAPEPKAEPAKAPEPEVAAEVEEEIGMLDQHEPHDPHEGHEHGEPGEDDPAVAFEMEQLRLLFGAGLTAYLRGQLGLLFNFALISLGRMPNPATGIVAADLEKARLAIDMFEFIASRIQGELQGAERNEVLQLVAELKYSFMQMAQAATPQTPPTA
jgi:hypothetical protein